MIYKGLDDEEAGFLNLITYQQTSRESQLIQQEKEEIQAFKVKDWIVFYWKIWVLFVLFFDAVFCKGILIRLGYRTVKCFEGCRFRGI